MSKTRTNLASWVLAGYGFSGVLMGNNTDQISASYCVENIYNYQKYSSPLFHTRQARAQHLIGLINNSSNKFKLVNELYLHYRSIDNAKSALSKTLELCLIDLLNIPRQDPAMIMAISKRDCSNAYKPAKLQDPVHEFIADHIVNLNFYPYNYPMLQRLMALDKLETGILKSSKLSPADFDEALLPKQSPVLLKRDPEFLNELRAACEKVMAVDYNGHLIFSKFNLAFVQHVIDLVEDSISTTDLKNAVASYLDKPEASTFDQIKLLVRDIYQAFTGERMAKSSSEYWAKVLNEVERIKQESIAEAWEQAEAFRAQPHVQNALFLKNQLTELRRNLDPKIALAGIEDFIKAYQRVAKFSPGGLGLYWSEADARSFSNLARAMRAFITNIDHRTRTLDQAIREFDGTRAKAAVLKSAAQSVYANIIQDFDTYHNLQREYDNKKQLIIELEYLEKYRDTLGPKLQDNISRAISNSRFRNLEGAQECAQLLIQALGEPQQRNRDRINAIFLKP